MIIVLVKIIHKAWKRERRGKQLYACILCVHIGISSNQQHTKNSIKKIVSNKEKKS